MILRDLNIVFNDDATVRAVRGQYVDVDARGKDSPVGTKRLTEAELSTALNQAALVASVDALTAERDALLAQVDAHDAEKAALQAQIDALKPPTDINGIPQEVSMYQARAALIGAGLYEQVNAAVAASTDEIVKVAWEYATVVRRSSPFIAAMSGALGLDDATIDQLFVSAAQIV